MCYICAIVLANRLQLTLVFKGALRPFYMFFDDFTFVSVILNCKKHYLKVVRFAGYSFECFPSRGNKTTYIQIKSGTHLSFQHGRNSPHDVIFIYKVWQQLGFICISQNVTNPIENCTNISFACLGITV